MLLSCSFSIIVNNCSHLFCSKFVSIENYSIWFCTLNWFFFPEIRITDEAKEIPVGKNNLLLRGCIIRNTDWVEGMVVYAGVQ